GTTIEGRQRFPIRVRYARDFRETPDALKDILVASPNGMQVPLGQLAEIRTVLGPAMINSENGLLRGTVLLNVRGRDVGSFIEESQRAVGEQVKLPSGYYIEWSGQFENQISAKKRLQVIIPIVLGVI